MVGLIFKNLLGDYVGCFVEECGLRGYCIGGVVILVEYVNVIINEGGVWVSEVFELMLLVCC